MKSEHSWLAEDIPFFVGTVLLLLITTVGILRGVRCRSLLIPVIVCAVLAFIAIVLAPVLNPLVPYY